MSKKDIESIVCSFCGKKQELVERMNADGASRPMTKAEFKERYFAYYDDVKDKSLKKQDW